MTVRKNGHWSYQCYWDHIVQSNKKVISAAATFGQNPMAMAEWARETQYQVSAKMWEASVKMNCWRNNFKLIQFIVDDDVEMSGSDWQKLVCKQINIPEQYAECFWQERGKKVARMAINRRRQNTGISMKKRFKDKCPVCAIMGDMTVLLVII
jgi:hypothetical protein